MYAHFLDRSIVLSSNSIIHVGFRKLERKQNEVFPQVQLVKACNVYKINKSLSYSLISVGVINLLHVNYNQHEHQSNVINLFSNTLKDSANLRHSCDEFIFNSNLI